MLENISNGHVKTNVRVLIINATFTPRLLKTNISILGVTTDTSYISWVWVDIEIWRYTVKQCCWLDYCKMNDDQCLNQSQSRPLIHHSQHLIESWPRACKLHLMHTLVIMVLTRLCSVFGQICIDWAEQSIFVVSYSQHSRLICIVTSADLRWETVGSWAKPSNDHVARQNFVISLNLIDARSWVQITWWLRAHRPQSSLQNYLHINISDTDDQHDC